MDRFLSNATPDEREALMEVMNELQLKDLQVRTHSTATHNHHTITPHYHHPHHHPPPPASLTHPPLVECVR
jgi:hypothetical protein